MALKNLPKEILNILKYMDTGLMLYHFIKDENKSDEDAHIAFIIKEDQFRLDRLKNMVSLEFISLGVNINKVLLIDVLMKFKDIDDTLYECVINGKNEGGKLAIKSLSHKNKYYIIFVNEHNEVYRQILTTNSGKKEFLHFEFLLSEYLDWSMNDFDKAKEEFNETYSDVFKLWKKYSKK